MWYRCNPPVPQCLNAYNLQTMSFLADICKCAREQARLELDSMAVAVPGGGGIRAISPKANHRGPTYLLPPKPKPGLLDPLGPLAEVDFLSGFRAPQDGSGPVGRIRDLQNEPGPRGMDPQDESGPRKTAQGP